MPPPLLWVEFPEIVLSWMVRMPLLKMPPPGPVAVLSAMVLSVMIIEPALSMPPPWGEPRFGSASSATVLPVSLA